MTELLRKLTKNETELAHLSWRIIEWKVQYYRPDLVHESWGNEFIIDDATYDAHELRYLELCRITKSPNTLVHKGYPGYDDYANAMLELDMERPSVQRVIKYMSNPKKI